MPLLFADISSGQRGISIAQLRREGVDGVIIKATGGAGVYTNPYFPEMVAEAYAENMLVGFYHYFVEKSFPIAGNGRDEWNHFYRTIAPYLRTGVNLVNDMEETYPGTVFDLNVEIESWRNECVAATATQPLGYVGTYFWRDNKLDVSRYRLWLPSWQETIPGPQYHEQHDAIEMWQHTSTAVKAGYNIDLNWYYGGREDWLKRGYNSGEVTIGVPGWLSAPYGPWQLWVHQYFHAAYNPELWGEPIGPAVAYTDGAIRQAFKNGVWGGNGRGEPRPESAGFSLAHSSGQPLGKVVADYDTIHPLLP